MSNSFKKFIQQGESGAKKKERIRQEKKQARKENQEYFEKKKEEARMARAQGGIKPTRHKGNEVQRNNHLYFPLPCCLFAFMPCYAYSSAINGYR